MEIVDVLCLDYAIAVKQIVSNARSFEVEGMNNCSRFYRGFVFGGD